MLASVSGGWEGLPGQPLINAIGDLIDILLALGGRFIDSSTL